MKIGIWATAHKTIPPEGYGGVQLINWISADGLVEAGHDVKLFARDGSKTKAELIKLPTGSGDKHEAGLAELYGHHFKNLDVLIDTSTYSFPGRMFPDINYLVRTGGDCNKRYCQFWTRNVVFPSIDQMKHHNEGQCPCSKQRRKFQGANIEPPILRKPVGYWMYSKNPDDLEQFENPHGQYFLYFGVIEPIKGTHHAVAFAKKAKIKLMIIGPIKDQGYFDEKIKPHIDNVNISYAGEIPSDGEAKWKIMGNAKALVFPTDCHDADPNVPKESLIVKTPVIGFANGAVPEIVTDGVTGILGKSVDELVSRLPELDKINPSNCKKEVLEKFSVESFIDNLVGFCTMVKDGKQWY